MRVGAFKRKDQHRSRRKGKHYFSNSLSGKKTSLSTIALVDDDQAATAVDGRDGQTPARSPNRKHSPPVADFINTIDPKRASPPPLRHSPHASPKRARVLGMQLSVSLPLRIRALPATRIFFFFSRRTHQRRLEQYRGRHGAHERERHQFAHAGGARMAREPQAAEGGGGGERAEDHRAREA